MIMYKLLITPDWDELRLPHLYSSGPHLHCHVHLASNKKLKIFIICKDNKMLYKRNHSPFYTAFETDVQHLRSHFCFTTVCESTLGDLFHMSIAIVHYIVNS
jgi:hypothetical protein